MSPEEQDLIRSRQKSRALITALLLGGFAVLVFAIAWVRITQGTAH